MGPVLAKFRRHVTSARARHEDYVGSWLPEPIVGLERVVRLYHGLARKFAEQPAVYVRSVWIDGLPGYVSRERDAVLQTTALSIEDGRVSAIYITRNPDKLGAVSG